MIITREALDEALWEADDAGLLGEKRMGFVVVRAMILTNPATAAHWFERMIGMKLIELPAQTTDIQRAAFTKEFGISIEQAVHQAQRSRIRSVK